MDTIGGRLKKATKRRRRSIRSFQRALHADGIRGSSYANVHAYFGGTTQPPVEFLTAAAAELGVRPAWLAFGELPESPVDEPVREAERKSAQEIFAEVDQVREGLMVELIRKLVVAQPEGSPQLSDDDFATVARAIRTHVDVTVFAFTKGGDYGPGTPLGQAVILSLMAMLAAVPGPGGGAGRSIADVLEKLPQRGPTRDHLELAKPKKRAAKKKGGQ